MKIKPFSLRVSMATLLTLSVFSLPAHALDPLEMLRKYPPGKDVLEDSSIELAQKMLAWQIERGELQADQLRIQVKQLEDTIARKEHHAAELATASGLGDFAFTTDDARDELLSGILSKLLDARVDIAENEIRVKLLEKRLAGSLEREQENDDLRNQLRALEVQLELLAANGKRLKDLQEQNAVSRQQVMEAQLKVHEVEAEMAKLKEADALRKRLAAANVAAPLVESRIDLQQLKARERVAAEQLGQLADATKIARQLRTVEREIDQLVRRMDRYAEKLALVTMKTDESRLLLQQIKNSLKRQEQETDK